MEEESISNDDSSQKTFKITSDKENKYIVTFKNIKSTLLLIEAEFDDENNKTFFESEFTLDKIKENKIFYFYDSIDEILEELYPLINEKKIQLIEEQGNKIEIIFDLPLKKYKNLKFLINEKKKTSDEEIDNLNNIISTKNKGIKDLKSNLKKEGNENKRVLKLISPVQPNLVSCYQVGILENSISQFLTEKEKLILSFSCRKLSFLAIEILKNKFALFNEVFGLYNWQNIDDKIRNLEEKFSKEELEAPLKDFEISRGSSKALDLLNEELLYLRAFTNPVPENILGEIVIVYKLFCQLLKMEDFVLIKDDKIFWEKISKFILDNKGNKLGDFITRCAHRFNFDNKNIFILKKLAKDKSEKLKPGNFSKICGTTGLFVFLIKDALEYCGVIETKKTPPRRIKSNYLFAKTLYDVNKYINFLEEIRKKSKIDEKKSEKNNTVE